MKPCIAYFRRKYLKLQYYLKIKGAEIRPRVVAFRGCLVKQKPNLATPTRNHGLIDIRKIYAGSGADRKSFDLFLEFQLLLLEFSDFQVI